MNAFSAESIRSQFPALQRSVEGRTPIFLDGPGGTQVPVRVIDAISHYLRTCNANHGGQFTTSRDSDALLHQAHQAVAHLLGATAPEEIVFGQNMTSLTFHLSRALARTWRPGDEVLVTRLDHDANVRPWVLAARDAGVTVRFVDINPSDCTLDLDDLQRQLNDRTRLLAVTAASNVVGTVNDISALAQRAHAVGALIYVDAVHYAPHGPIDVTSWDCDFLACSAYKFFGPHVGILWGRASLLRELEPYKVKPCADTIPDRWMTGTQNHEGIAGVTAAIDYLSSLMPGGLRASMEAIREHEQALGARLLAGLAERPRFRVWGITEPCRLAERVPTISITATDRSPQEIARHLAQREIYTWNGNMYAYEISERLGLESQGGFLRLGFVHYNTAHEVDQVLSALDDL